MLTIKNWRALASGFALALGLLGTLTGCTPAGPRALLEGERLIQAGKYSQAATKLERATQLLPSQAQAWNHLGLAYHHLNRHDEALKAYEQARRLDFNLTAVRYNLGCLHFDQNNYPAAISEFTSYTLLQPDSPDGWLQLGTAQLRSRQFDNAERSFQKVLRLRPDSPQAWNSLGVIQAQRRRPREALNCFNLALQRQAAYGPALLNLAVLQQFYLNNRTLALQKYQEYLQAQPNATEARAAQDMIRQLQAELSPSSHRESTNLAANPLPPTVQTLETNHPGATAATPPTNRPTNPTPPPRIVVEEVTAPATNIVAERSRNSPTPGRGKPSAPQTVPSSEAPPVVVTAPTAVTPAPITSAPSTTLSPNRQGPLAHNAPPTAPNRAEIVQLNDEPLPKIAQDDLPAASSSTPALAASATPTAPPGATPERPLPDLASKPSSEASAAERRRPLNRLNPSTWFRGQERPPPRPTPLEPVSGKQAVAERPQTEPNKAVKSSLPAGATDRRYTYQVTQKPRRGDRAAAERYFTEAVQAHRERRLAEAVEAYRQAVKLDPSFFEANYNLGLAAFELKELALSLSAYETAVSINPTSVDGRYNFAVALETGGYYTDAAHELEKLLEQNREESRAHLSLASLYAERLGRFDLARIHYRRVLELTPQHPQAAAIRYWLAANP